MRDPQDEAGAGSADLSADSGQNRTFLPDIAGSGPARRKIAEIGRGAGAKRGALKWHEEDQMGREQQVQAGAMVVGVCALVASWADVDPFLVRLNAVLLTLVAAPIAIALYAGASYWVKKRRQAIAA
jgi:phage shock protein PspC (stress-responsive transcriptional regulator)